MNVWCDNCKRSADKSFISKWRIFCNCGIKTKEHKYLKDAIKEFKELQRS